MDGHGRGQTRSERLEEDLFWLIVQHYNARGISPNIFTVERMVELAIQCHEGGDCP